MGDLRGLIGGFRVSQALHVAATLGIADLLAGGERTSGELARETGADEDALYRLLRALAHEGVFAERHGRRFALTELGQGLRSDVPGSLHAYAAHVGRPYHWNAWGELLVTVCTGEPGFPRLHGESAWEYRSKHPDDGALFDAWMTGQTRIVDEALVSGYDFSRFRSVVDVGGGKGAFLRAILRANPSVRGTLFDQPHVVDAVDDLDVVGGSFFDEVPRGGDAYTLKWVIHDWDDDAAAAILRTCAAALTSEARVLVIERDLAVDPAAPWMDVQMLVMLGGRERTEDEYAALFRAAGLDYVGATRVDGHAVFEARA